MPIYEYFCEQCGLVFEELVPRAEGHDTATCKSCGEDGAKKQVSAAAFSLKGEGFHRNDYPTVDQAVGASADKRWATIHKRRSEKENIRKKTGHGALIRDQDGTYAPAKTEVVEARNKMGNEYSTALQENRERRKKTGLPQSDTLKPD